MSDWKCYQLKNLGVIKTGKTPPSSCKDVFSNTGVPFVTPKDMNGVKTIFKTERYLSKIGLDLVKNYLVPKNSIAVSCIGSDMGKAYLLSEDSVTNQQINTLIVNKNHNFEFIYYKLSIMQDYLKSIAGGSATPILNKSHFSEIEIELPDLDTQNNFVEKLKYLDKKIQLNTQINQTLEQIAQALFKSWFVDFDPVRAKVQALSDGLSLEQAELAAMQAISGKTPEELTALSQTQPERYAELAETTKAFPCEMVEVDGVEVPKGWEYQYLKDICNIVYGKNLPTTKLIKEGYPVFGGNGVIGYYDKFLYETPQTLVSCRGAASGKVLYSLPYSFVTNNSLVIEHEKSGLSYFYIYEVLKLQNLTELTSGSAQPQMTIANMAAVQILVPSEKINEVYKKYAGTLYDKKYQNNIENEALAQTRDLLLPRLLSGEFND